MADGARAFEPLDDIFLEGIGDQSHLPMGNQPSAVRGNNAARFLAAVLQGIEPKIDHVGRLGMAIDAHDRAFVVEFVRHRYYRFGPIP